MIARKPLLRIALIASSFILFAALAAPSVGTFIGYIGTLDSPPDDALLVPVDGCPEYVELDLDGTVTGRGDPVLEVAISALPPEVRCFTYVSPNIYPSSAGMLQAAYGEEMRWYCQLISNPVVPNDAECTPEWVDTGFSPDPNCEVVFDANVPDRVIGQDCTAYLMGLYEQMRDEIVQQQANGYSCKFFTQDGKFPTFDEWANGTPGLGPNDPVVSCATAPPTCITPEGGKSWCDGRPSWCDAAATGGQPGWCDPALGGPLETAEPAAIVDVVIECLDESAEALCTATEYSRATGELLRSYPVKRP